MKRVGVLLMVALLFSVWGCNKDGEPSFNDIPNELLGVWVNNEVEYGSESRFIIERRSEKSGYLEYYWNIKLSSSESFVTLMAAKTTFVIQGNRMIPTILQWGTQLHEFDEEIIYDQIKWYTMEDTEWEWFDNSEEEMSIVFELKNGQLLIKEDYNEDGDYNDEGEVEVYVREE